MACNCMLLLVVDVRGHISTLGLDLVGVDHCTGLSVLICRPFDVEAASTGSAESSADPQC